VNGYLEWNQTVDDEAQKFSESVNTDVEAASRWVGKSMVLNDDVSLMLHLRESVLPLSRSESVRDFSLCAERPAAGVPRLGEPCGFHSAIKRSHGSQSRGTR